MLDSEGEACVTEEELGIQLEEWEASEEKQDAPLSAMDDQLLFESKDPISSFLYSLQLVDIRDFGVS